MDERMNGWLKCLGIVVLPIYQHAVKRSNLSGWHSNMGASISGGQEVHGATGNVS
jgi:hypothetical protein